MRDKNPHKEALDRHIEWVEATREEWQAHWSAYDDDYWSAAKARPVVSVQGTSVAGVFGDPVDADGDLFGAQTNLTRPYVTSQMSSLYYNGIQLEVQADEIPGQGDTREAVSRRAKAIQSLASRWIEDVELDTDVERLLTMGLMFKGAPALRLEVVPPDDRIKGQRAIDIVRPCVVPPWEGFWDRKTRTKAATSAVLARSRPP